MKPDALRHHATMALPFGGGAAIILFAALAFIVIVGASMGDCLPADNCHTNDGPIILAGLFWASGIAALFGVAMWLIAAAADLLLARFFGIVVRRAALLVATLIFVYLNFESAGEPLLKLGPYPQN